jgi:hypothetical protein
MQPSLSSTDPTASEVANVAAVVALTARAQRWTPEDTAGVLAALGLDDQPLVARALRRHRLDVAG